MVPLNNFQFLMLRLKLLWCRYLWHHPEPLNYVWPVRNEELGSRWSGVCRRCGNEVDCDEQGNLQ